MAFLQIESGELNGRKFELGSDPLTIGRAPDNQVILTDTAVSTHHCQIALQGEQFVLQDLESTNGTVVNDGPVKETALQDGDIIIIGANIMSFRSGEVSAEEPEAEAGEEAEVEEFVPEQAPAAVRSSASLADAFAPRHRKNLVLVPVLAVVLICVAVAGIFFLNRLFNH